MLILFDHGTPRGLIQALYGHTVVMAQSKGWDRLSNGALLTAAEKAGIDILLSTDQGIRYQQNLAGRKIALVVLTGTTKWSRVRLYFDRITAAVAAAKSGTYHPANMAINRRCCLLRIEMPYIDNEEFWDIRILKLLRDKPISKLSWVRHFFSSAIRTLKTPDIFTRVGLKHDWDQRTFRDIASSTTCCQAANSRGASLHSQ